MKLSDNKRRTLSLLTASSLLALLTVLALAQQHSRPEVKITLTGLIQRGAKATPVEQAGRINPGEVIDWTIGSLNQGNAAAHGYQTVGQIPKGTVFIAGTANAEGNVSVTFSIDNGRSFAETPLIEVRQPDNTVKQVPAPVAMYTQLRFEWNQALAPGEQRTATYRVRVR